MKPKKILKRIVVFIGILLFLLLLAMVAIPYFFKDEVLRAVKEQANASMNATLDFEDVDLSFFRQFPLLTIGIKNYTLKGQEVFEGVELAGGERIDISFRIRELFGESTPTIRAIHLERPRVKVLVLQDGAANYDIAKSDGEEEVASSVYPEDQELLRLQKFSIHDGEIVYEDRLMDFYLGLQDLNLNGSGNFTANTYALDLQSKAKALTLAYGGMTYLTKVHTSLDAGLLMDLADMRFELRDNRLLLNDLPLQAEGYIALPEEAMEMDLHFSSPGSNFKQLFSILPYAYTPAYADAEINGSFRLQGNVKGVMAEEAYPAMDIRLEVKNGSVQYPDLPMGLRDIRAEASVESPQGSLDGIELNIPIVHFKLGENPFSAKLQLKTPVSDPDIDFRVKGVIDLDDLAKAYPIEGVRVLSGRLQADVQARVRMSQIEKEQYDQVKMSGQMLLTNLQYEAEDQPPVSAKKIALNFSPQYVDLEEALLRAGKSDFSASARIDNLPALFSSSQPLRGQFKLRSGYLLVDEWMEPVPETEAAPTPAVTEENNTAVSSFDFEVDLACDKLVYDTYVLENAMCKGRGGMESLQVEELSFDMGKSDFRFTGAFRQIDEYLFDDGVLSGELAFRSHYLDLNPLMESEEEGDEAGKGSEAETYEPIDIPRNLRLNILADIDELLYTDITLYDLQARVLIENGQAVLEKCNMKTLGGSVALSGLYDTSVEGDPFFNLKYDLSGMDFQKAYETFNTFQSLAPMAKYVKGKFNSSLILEGNLGLDLMPKYDRITADGFLETLQGRVEGFPALAAVDQQLGVPLLSGMELKDTRNWFEVRQGRVEVKPFDYRWNEIDMNISGSHGIADGSMDYYILADVPREKLGSFANAALDKGLDALQKQAGSLGLSLEQAETVQLGITLKGSISNPKIGIKLVGTDGQNSVKEAAKKELQETITEEKEKLKSQAEEKVDEAKQQAREELDKVASQAEEAVQEEINKTVEKAEEKAGEVIGQQAGELGKKAEEALGEQGKKAKEEIEQQLENFNPFKKKKDKKKKKGGN